MANGIKLGNLDISAFKVGSGDCSIYLGETLIYSGGTTPPSPSEYTELEWIEMPQTSPYCAVQLVDSYSGYSSIWYDFTILFNSLQDTRIICFEGSKSFLIGNGGYEIYLNINNRRIFTKNGFVTGTTYHLGLGNESDSSSTLYFKDLDTSTTLSSSYNTYLPRVQKPLFGAIIINNQYNVNEHSERIYSIKLYNNGNLIGDYIPVKRNSDNFVTLYDKVSEQYCDTVGGGTMVAGPVK